MWQQASGVLNQLQSGDQVLDPNQIAGLVAQTRGSPESGIATYVLIGCWLGGMIDTYWLGKKLGAN